jgi:hypothetical protein
MKQMTLTGIRTVAVLAASSLLASCAAIPGDFGRSPEPGTGCMIISWGDQTKDVSLFGSFRTSAVFFRRGGDERFGALGYSPKAIGQSGVAFDTPSDHGRVQVRYLQPGAYVLSNPQVSSVSGPVVYTKKPTRQVDIPFRIQANRCVYIGRFVLQAQSDQFLWTSVAEADLALIRKEVVGMDLSTFDVVKPYAIQPYITTGPTGLPSGSDA